jgi:hypothetical protein
VARKRVWTYERRPSRGTSAATRPLHAHRREAMEQIARGAAAVRRRRAAIGRRGEAAASGGGGSGGYGGSGGCGGSDRSGGSGGGGGSDRSDENGAAVARACGAGAGVWRRRGRRWRVSSGPVVRGVCACGRMRGVHPPCLGGSGSMRLSLMEQRSLEQAG